MRRRYLFGEPKVILAILSLCLMFDRKPCLVRAEVASFVGTDYPKSYPDCLRKASEELGRLLGDAHEAGARIRWDKGWKADSVSADSNKTLADKLLGYVKRNRKCISQHTPKIFSLLDSKNTQANAVQCLLNVMNGKEFKVTNEEVRKEKSQTVRFYLSASGVQQGAAETTTVAPTQTIPEESEVTTTVAPTQTTLETPTEQRTSISRSISNVYPSEGDKGEGAREFENMGLSLSAMQTMVVLVIVFLVPWGVLCVLFWKRQKNGFEELRSSLCDAKKDLDEIGVQVKASLAVVEANISQPMIKAMHDISDRVLQLDLYQPILKELREISEQIRSIQSQLNERIKGSSVKEVGPRTPGIAEGGAVEEDQVKKGSVDSGGDAGNAEATHVDEMLEDYHKVLRGNFNEQDFAEKYSLALLTIVNFSERSRQSGITASFAQTKLEKEAHLWFVGRKYLLPSRLAYENLSSLTAGGGRGSDPWFNGLFEVSGGTDYRVVRPCSMVWVDKKYKKEELGKLHLPLSAQPGSDEPGGGTTSGGGEPSPSSTFDVS